MKQTTVQLTPTHLQAHFIFSQRTNAFAEKNKNSLQANTQRQTVMDRHSTTEKNNEPLTAPTRNWRFSASYVSFVVQQTLVLRINPDSYRDGKNCHLRQAAKR